MRPGAIADPNIEYPDSDGELMSDNTVQGDWIVKLKNGLDYVFRNDPNVFVAADLLWYAVEGDPKKRMAPDAMVAIGRPKGDRGSYMQWLEDDVPPQVTFEILSPSNGPTEMETKLRFYERHGVDEYYIYDPEANDLVGYLRDDDGLVRIASMDSWISPALGIRFDTSGSELRVFDADGVPFEQFVDVKEERETAKLREAEARLETAEALRNAAEAKRREEAAKRREETAEREAETARRQAETANREAAETNRRNALLIEKLRSLGIDPDA